MSLLVLDLDRLKSLNDTHGHLTGAEAVRTVGHILGSQLPADAVACRYGGDEFVVALPRRSEADVLGIADGLCRAVHESAPTLAGKRFPAGTLSISVGVAHRNWTVEFPDPRTDERAGESLFVLLTCAVRARPRTESGLRAWASVARDRRRRRPSA